MTLSHSKDLLQKKSKLGASKIMSNKNYPKKNNNNRPYYKKNSQ